jgi:hypothetical protein
MEAGLQMHSDFQPGVLRREHPLCRTGRALAGIVRRGKRHERETDLYTGVRKITAYSLLRGLDFQV